MENYETRHQKQMCIKSQSCAGGYHLTREQLMHDLYRAYLDARKHKRGKPYQVKFEMHLEDNLTELCDALYERTYQPLPSKCFTITDPTLREVFAADFRDRVVHHLYYNYTYQLFDQTFIDDSYSCRKGRGTLYGVKRLEQHVREESANFTRACYVLKMDVSGYFMHINRNRLLTLCLQTLSKMARRKMRNAGIRWNELIDMDFVEYLTRGIVLLNPVEDCRVFGRKTDWHRLPMSKSLFHSDEGCGLPIGNLTSQVFSNVYMNVFDQWMKRTLKCRHYGRYVDDFFVVSHDRRWLAGIVERCKDFLHAELGLAVNHNKTIIYDIRHGVPFLGSFLKPWRTYIDNRTWKRMKTHVLREVENAGILRLRSSVNSYLGLLRHVNSFKITQGFFKSIPRLSRLGHITSRESLFVLSDFTLDTMLLNKMLLMIEDGDYPLEFADIEVWCHDYVDKYVEIGRE